MLELSIYFSGYLLAAFLWLLDDYYVYKNSNRDDYDKRKLERSISNSFYFGIFSWLGVALILFFEVPIYISKFIVNWIIKKAEKDSKEK